MFAPVRPIRGRWPASLERRAARFFWADPSVLHTGAASPDEFRAAMSAIHVGETIKITGSNRQPLSDALLIDNVDLTDARIVDIGASDGSTSVDLIRKIGRFNAYVIADLYFNIFAVRVGRRICFYDQNGQWILVVGPRAIAWPSLSKKVSLLYSRVARAGARKDRDPVLLLNPATQDIMAKDERISYQTHDVFDVWHGPTPDVIKVANLLRRLYFSDDQIAKALHSILASLDQGGYLLMVDNPRIEGIAERGGLYRRRGDGFEAVSLTPNPPEIDDLIMAARLDEKLCSS
jgi:hypothetical protein